MEVDKPIKDIVIGIVASILSYVILQNPLYALAVGVLFVATSYGIIKFFGKYSRYAAAKKLGITRIFVNRNDSQDVLTEYFREAKDVRILAIRGKYIIGSDRAILPAEISKLPFNSYKKIRILLQNPESPYTNERAKEVGLSDDQYREECLLTAKFIESLKKVYPHIDIAYKYYDMKYFWTFTLMDKKGFFSYYTGRKEGPELPYYEISSGYGTLHEALSKLFEQIWSS